jgi:hypothetical protein
VSGVQEQVGDLAAARGYGNSDDVPDSAVEGICRVIAAQGSCPGRRDVIGEGLRPRVLTARPSGPAIRRPDWPPRRYTAGPPVRMGDCMYSAWGSWKNSVAVHPSEISPGAEQVKRDQAAELMRVVRFDHQVGDRHGHGVYDDPAHQAAGAVATSGGGPDQVHSQPRHRVLTSPADLL